MVGEGRGVREVARYEPSDERSDRRMLARSQGLGLG